MTKTQFGLQTFVLSAVAAFVVGVTVGSLFIADVWRTPCAEVLADLQDARNTLSETFGTGEEGAAALATLREAARDRPDCFSQADRALLHAEPAEGGTDFATEVPTN